MQAHLRGITARPFLPKYFPGFDIYLWLDADTWVQERFAIERFIAAADGGMGLVSEFQAAFHSPSINEWRHGRLEAYFGKPGVLAARKDYFNSGVFSLAADAPHWSSWKEHFRQGLKRSPQLACDQSALNHAIFRDKLKVNALPAVCNWLCNLSLPVFDAGSNKLRCPTPPHDLIGLVHMAGGSKGVTLHCAYNDLEATYDLLYKG
jgi:hypothetical protein